MLETVNSSYRQNCLVQSRAETTDVMSAYLQLAVQRRAMHVSLPHGNTVALL